MKAYSAIATISLLLLGAATSVHAATGVGQVARIFPNSGTSVLFRLKNDSCIDASAYYYFDQSHPQAKAWLALLYLNVALEKDVKVSLPACGVAGNQQITHIYADY